VRDKHGRHRKEQPDKEVARAVVVRLADRTQRLSRGDLHAERQRDSYHANDELDDAVVDLLHGSPFTA